MYMIFEDGDVQLTKEMNIQQLPLPFTDTDNVGYLFFAEQLIVWKDFS